MKKLVLILVLIVFLTSACTKTTATPLAPAPVALPTLTDDQVLKERNERIMSFAPKFLDENIWSMTPQTCYKSMARLILSSSTSKLRLSASASLVQSQNMLYMGKNTWIYRFQTANHVAIHESEKLDGKADLYFGNNTSSVNANYSDYTQFVDERGEGVDSGLITLIGSEQITPQTIPLGIKNIISGNELISDQSIYFSFDYPLVTNSHQFGISKVIASGNTKEGKRVTVMEFFKDSSTMSEGSSGGAVCNQDGQHVGLISQNNPHSDNYFVMQANPTNIQQQLLDAIQKSNQKLLLLGYQPTP